MKKGIFLGLVALSSLSSAHAMEKGLPICFLPGAGGGNTDSMVHFRDKLQSRGIGYVPFELGKVGTVMDRAHKLQGFLKTILEKNPDFRCHAFAYSMGGPVARYTYHHLSVTLSSGEVIPLKNVFVSLSTFSSPHHGTPLAEWLKRYSPKYAAGMDDLSAADMEKYNSPVYPETYSPEPKEIPSYSYQTYIHSREEGDDFLAKIGFQLIADIHNSRGLDPVSDGVVPTQSQIFGQVLGKLNASHGFFSYEIGLRPEAPDFYEAQWHFLNGDTPSPEAQQRLQNVLESKIFSGAALLKSILNY
ncbi:MAG: hypothetical protein ABIR96_08505 [Bdellovibrionota bacterium]